MLIAALRQYLLLPAKNCIRLQVYFSLLCAISLIAVALPYALLQITLYQLQLHNNNDRQEIILPFVADNEEDHLVIPSAAVSNNAELELKQPHRHQLILDNVNNNNNRNNNKPSSKIPRIVHFLFSPSLNKSSPSTMMRFHQFLAIKAAAIYLRPKQLYVHYLNNNDKPRGHWLKQAAKYITQINKLTSSSSINNNISISFTTVNNDNDTTDMVRRRNLELGDTKELLVRIDILQNYGGGIYLDLDLVVVNDFFQYVFHDANSELYLIKHFTGPDFVLPLSLMVSSEKPAVLDQMRHLLLNIDLSGLLDDDELLSLSSSSSSSSSQPAVPLSSRVLAMFSRQFSDQVALLNHSAVFWPTLQQNGLLELYLSKNFDFEKDPECFAISLQSQLAGILLDDLTVETLKRLDTSLFCSLRTVLMAGGDTERRAHINKDFEQLPDILRKGCGRLDVSNRNGRFAHLYDGQQGAWNFADNKNTLPKLADLSGSEMDAILSPLNGYRSGSIYNESRSYMTLTGDHIYIPVMPVMIEANLFAVTAEINLLPRRNTVYSRATIFSIELHDCTQLGVGDVQCSQITLNLERPYDGSLALVVYYNRMEFASVDMTAVFADEWHNVSLSVTTDWAVLLVDGVKIHPFLDMRNTLIRPPNHKANTLRSIWLGIRANENLLTQPAIVDHSFDAHFRVARAWLHARALHDPSSNEFLFAHLLDADSINNNNNLRGMRPPG